MPDRLISLDAACKAACWYCRDGVPLQDAEHHCWRESSRGVMCRALLLRALPAFELPPRAIATGARVRVVGNVESASGWKLPAGTEGELRAHTPGSCIVVLDDGAEWTLRPECVELVE